MEVIKNLAKYMVTLVVLVFLLDKDIVPSPMTNFPRTENVPYGDTCLLLYQPFNTSSVFSTHVTPKNLQMMMLRHCDPRDPSSNHPLSHQYGTVLL